LLAAPIRAAIHHQHLKGGLSRKQRRRIHFMNESLSQRLILSALTSQWSSRVGRKFWDSVEWPPD
jgi:hypothetical protein